MRTLAAFLFLGSTFLTSAQVPQLINYQGRLLLGTNLVNGGVGLSLRLFNVSSGGTMIYEDSNSVTVADGLYSTFIGDNPASDSFLSSLTNAAVYVEVAVNGTTLTPRERLASAGYSLNTRGLLATTNSSIVLNPAENTVNSFADHSSVGGGKDNNMGGADFSAIGGGSANSINGDYSFLGGGESNSVEFGAHRSAIGGGVANNIDGATESFIGGGEGNSIGNVANKSTIAGGFRNTIESFAFFSTIGGGNQNIIRSGAQTATIPGGYGNQVAAGANYAFAAGVGAYANHASTFVWSDDDGFLGGFSSTGTNQFLIRASGGVGINTNRPGAALHVSGEAIIGPDASAARFAMKRVALTGSGTVFAHPGDTNLIMEWDSANRVLLVTNSSVTTFCDVQMQLVRETNASVSATADIRVDFLPFVVSLTNTAMQNAGWSVTAIMENPTGGPGFQFHGTGWNNEIRGLITYWY